MAGGGWFRRNSEVQRVDLGGGQVALVVDDALLDAEGLVQRAADLDFVPASANAYPGLLAEAAPGLLQDLCAFFDERLRTALGGRRRIDAYARFGLVTLAPPALRPAQRLCHRDPLGLDPAMALMAAGVLYLFQDQRLGGTSFYRPRCSEAALQQLIADQGSLSNQAFDARYGFPPGYMTGSNAFFEQVAHVPPRWNRLVFYDGSVFHSGHIDHPELLSADPLRGRLTLNSFIACRRTAR